MTPDDPVGWLTREPDAGLASREAWMLRVVDPAAAVAGRGFPAAADLAIALRIDDAQLPANAGLWRLEVSGGRGSLQPQSSGTDGDGPAVPAGPVRLGARGFAALYSGVPMATLRLAGLATGGDPAPTTCSTPRSPGRPSCSTASDGRAAAAGPPSAGPFRIVRGRSGFPGRPGPGRDGRRHAAGNAVRRGPGR